VAAIVVTWILTRDGEGGGGAAASTPDVTAAVSSDESGTLTTPAGATLEIPVGAVPLTQNGEVGQIVFTMDEKPTDDRQANLPQGLELAPTAIDIGPDFQTLASPAVLTVPIPAEVAIDRVGGLTWLDETSGQWVLVPSRVDTASRTVSADVTHFSTWSWWRERDDSDRRWKSENGGYVAVANYISSSIGFPTDFFGWGDRRSSYTSYGICIDGYYVEDEVLRSNTWWQPYDWMIMQRAFPGSDFERPQDGRYEYWLPQGQYEMREVIFFSEMNRSTGYVPAYGWASRPLGSVIIASGGQVQATWTEEERVDDYSLQSGGWVGGRPDCAGREMAAPGHGEVQVQLIWPQENVDLDLHVTEPDGFEINYIDDVSPSGGWLDYDNLFGAGVPENVFWTDPPTGTYTVDLVYFSGEVTASWTIRTIVQGQIEIYTGTISPSGDFDDNTRIRIAEFRVR
jgi:hypothetical protein